MTEAKAKPSSAKATDGKTAKKTIIKSDSSRRYTETLGKRKTAAARVRIYEGGKGDITVNGVALDKYFPAPTDRMVILEPLKTAALETAYDFTIRVTGGGKQGQAAAVRHGIACALLELNKELRGLLKAEGWLTRDARRKERKKPGLRKARRAPQWSKR